eukprot:Sspe_Gene.109309::Locus_89175_Transcript_1_5_Confidence_0.545_Length_404::g.109309::m.109309
MNTTHHVSTGLSHSPMSGPAGVCGENPNPTQDDLSTVKAGAHIHTHTHTNSQNTCVHSPSPPHGHRNNVPTFCRTPVFIPPIFFSLPSPFQPPNMETVM